MHTPAALVLTTVLVVAATAISAADDAATEKKAKSNTDGSARANNALPTRTTRTVAGWTIRIDNRLIEQDQEKLERAVTLLTEQLKEIVNVVPAPAVKELQKVVLWMSPEYKGFGAKAEYHPDVGWLRKNDRDPEMAKGIEFTNIRIFEAETRRMPNFALHELAHAYHDRVLGFEHPEVNTVYQQAKSSGTYDRVLRQDSEGNRQLDRAYALTNPKEYFAECTEAFFSRNDFFPFNRQELRAHDPAMFSLLERLWGAEVTR